MTRPIQHRLSRLRKRVRAAGTMCTLLLATTAYSESITLETYEDCKNAFKRLNTAQQSHNSEYGIDNTNNPIHFTSWNIQKASQSGIKTDLQHLAGKSNFLILQEAPDIPWIRALKHYNNFAPGYIVGDTTTGVMVLGDTPQLLSCVFTHKEPWLRSPKASSISVFELENGQKLAIANIHSINFTFGVKLYEQQLSNITQLLTLHHGPIVLSGDFNTWKRKRGQILKQNTEALGLREVHFETDFRSQVFGHVLDRFYIRNIHLEASQTEHYHSSDHNPLQVTLRLDSSPKHTLEGSNNAQHSP